MKKLFGLLLLFTVCLICGCADENTLPKGKIVITTSPDYAPFEFIDTNKSGDEKYVGADIELMKYIAQEMDLELVIEATDFDSTLALLQAGKADLAISGYTYREDRSGYAFSDPYSNEGTQGVLVKKDSGITSLEELNKSGVKVLAQAGSVQCDYVGEYLPNAELVPFSKINDGLINLDADKGVAIAIASEVADIIVANNSDKYVYLEETFPVDIASTQVYVLAKKSKTLLMEEVNKIIAEVVEKGLYKQWWAEANELAISLGEM